MKYVYLVQGRSFINNKPEFCGVAYYTSYEKALRDFNDRLDNYKTYELIYELDEEDTCTHIKEFKVEGLTTEIQLLKHEVY